MLRVVKWPFHLALAEPDPVAGEDTTAHTLTFAEHLLTEHPEVRRRIQ